MSERTTPETEILYNRLLAENPGNLIYLAEMLHHARKMERERDEARAELADWKDSAVNVRKQYDDEQHCSCVPILRKLLKDAERERDEANYFLKELAEVDGQLKLRINELCEVLQKAEQERDEARLDKRVG